jgi:hypothetical protein
MDCLKDMAKWEKEKRKSYEEEWAEQVTTVGVEAEAQIHQDILLLLEETVLVVL